MRFKRDRSIRYFLVLEAALYAFPGRGIITVRDSIRQLLTAACIASSANQWLLPTVRG